MPVIQTWSPLGPALEGLGAYGEKKNDNAEKARTLALQLAKEKQQQDNVDREFHERSREWQDDHDLNVKRTEADIAHINTGDTIAKAAEARAAALAPLVRDQMHLENVIKQKTAMQMDVQTDVLKLQKTNAQLDNAIKAITLKHGPEMADIAVKQARANVQRTYAETNATNASADSSRASAAYSRAAAAAVGTKRSDPFQHLDLSGIESQLSEPGRKFLNMITGAVDGGMPQISSPTQVMSALAQSALPSKDKQTIAHAISTPAFRTAFLDTAHSNVARGDKADHIADVKKRQGGMDSWAVLAAPGTPFMKLPQLVQGKAKALILQHGLTVSDFKAGLQDALKAPQKNRTGFSPAEIQAVLQTLPSVDE